jgi:PAS domain-containing protein
MLPVLRLGLDALSFGFAVFDQELKLVVWNRAFRALRDYPAVLCRAGTDIGDLYHFNAERGEYGAGDVDKQVRLRLVRPTAVRRTTSRPAAARTRELLPF